MSTVAVPGIYNSPYLPQPTEVEVALRQAKPQDHPQTRPKLKYNPTASKYDLPVPRPPSLPPLHKKPQVLVIPIKKINTTRLH